MTVSHELETNNTISNNWEEFGNNQSTPSSSENRETRSDKPLLKRRGKQGMGIPFIFPRTCRTIINREYFR